MLEEGTRNILLCGSRNDLFGRKCGSAVSRRGCAGSKDYKTGGKDDSQGQAGLYKEFLLRESYLVSLEETVRTLVSALTPLRITSANFIGLVSAAADRVHGSGGGDNDTKLRKFMKRFLKSYRGLDLGLDRLQSLATYARKRPAESGPKGRVLKTSRRIAPEEGGGFYSGAAGGLLPEKIEYLRDVSQLSLLASSSAERMMTLIRVELDLILRVSAVEKRLTPVLFDLTCLNAELTTLARCMAGVRCAVAKYDACQTKNYSNPKILATLAHRAVNIFAETLNLLKCECDKSFKSSPDDVEKTLQAAICASIKMIKKLRPMVRCPQSAEGGVKISSSAGRPLLDAAEVFAIDIIRVAYTIGPADLPCAQCSRIPHSLLRLRQLAALMHRLVSEYKLGAQTAK